jgi:hypothetical protein
MAEYDDSASVLVGDVDCTAAGKPLCDSNGVRGFPTIKHGDPSALEDYNGGRDYDALSKFAGDLKPLCSPFNKDLCDDEGRANIEKYEAMSGADLDAAIAAGEGKLADAEETFKNEVKKLQETYEQLMADKSAAEEDVKSSGLGLMRAVKAAKAASADKEEL